MITPRLFRFALVGALLAGALCLSACSSANLAKDGAYNGDKTLYDADVGVATAYDVIDLFLSYDLANKATVSAATHALAEKLRAEAPGYFRSYTAIRQAYVSEPTPENRLKLTGALAVLTAAVAEARAHMVTPLKTAWYAPLFLRHRISV